MNCQRCNHPLPPGSNFCLACGYENPSEENENAATSIIKRFEEEDRKERNTVLKLLLVVGLLLIIGGGVWLYFSNYKRTHAKEYSTLSKICSTSNVSDAFIAFNNNSIVLTKSGDVFYLQTNNKDELVCNQIKELKNVKSITDIDTFSVVELNSGEKKYYKLLLFDDSYLLSPYSSTFLKEYYEKLYEKNKIVRTVYISNTRYYLSEDNNLYTQLSSDDDHKILIGSLVDNSSIESFYNSRFYSYDLIKGNKCFYEMECSYFSDSCKVGKKYEKIKQFTPNDIKLLLRSDNDNSKHFIIDKDFKVYLSDSKLVITYINFSDLIPVFKSLWENLKGIIIVGIIIDLLVLILSYFGREKSFKSSYIKNLIASIVLIFAFLVFYYIKAKSHLKSFGISVSVSFPQFLSALFKSLEFKDIVKIIISLALTSFLFNVYYFTLKKINWYFMKLSKSNNFILYFVYFLLINPILTAIYGTILYYILKALSVLTGALELIKSISGV